MLQGGSPPENTLSIAAASPGLWGNNLQIGVDHNTRSAGLFNLVVREVVTVDGRRQVVNSETYRNLSMSAGSSRNAVSVVNEASSLVQLTGQTATPLPTPTGTDVVASTSESDFLPLGGSASDGDIPGSSAWQTSGPSALIGSEAARSGMHALDGIVPFIFNILCLPAAAGLSATGLTSVVTAAEAYCESKRAFFLLDIPASINTLAEMTGWMTSNDGLRHRNAAVYFPRLEIPDLRNESRLRDVGPSGTLAGVFARTDATRGVWKAPAGTDADLRGAAPVLKLNDLDNGAINPLGINALRNFPIFGNISWGGRTLDGADQQASEWKYIPVRRTALYIEESLYQGLKWVVFEPNDEPLWAQIRLNAGAFMQNLFRQGAFQGATPRDAYFVKCDKETTTQNDINLGIVNIVVGFAPLKPAEFVVIKLQQMAGQVAV